MATGFYLLFVCIMAKSSCHAKPMLLCRPFPSMKRRENVDKTKRSAPIEYQRTCSNDSASVSLHENPSHCQHCAPRILRFQCFCLCLSVTPHLKCISIFSPFFIVAHDYSHITGHMLQHERRCILSRYFTYLTIVMCNKSLAIKRNDHTIAVPTVLM